MDQHLALCQDIILAVAIAVGGNVPIFLFAIMGRVVFRDEGLVEGEIDPFQRVSKRLGHVHLAWSAGRRCALVRETLTKSYIAGGRLGGLAAERHQDIARRRWP